MLRKAIAGDGSDIAPFLRQQDVNELKAVRGLGVNIAAVLEEAVEVSNGDAWVTTVDDQVVSIGGVKPYSFDGRGTGVPWMVAAWGAPASSFMKDIRPAVWEMYRKYELLVNLVDMRNSVSIQWLYHMGFEFGDIDFRHGALKLPFIQFYMVTNKECAIPSQ